MKKQIAKAVLLTLCAAAAFAAPALSRAQDSTNAPAAAPASHKTHSIRYKGNLSAVDTNAMTITVKTLTLQVTSKTKITKDGQPATLADGVVGQPVSGSYRLGDNGATNAVSIHFGAKKKKSTSSDSSDN
ncbi:MAG: hypothetical protein ACLQSR_08335 [Limisphaerales bacterium]